MRRRGPPALLKDASSEAAKRARSAPDLLAWALASFRKRHRLSEDGLAEFLGISIAQLAELALCARPEAALPGFGDVVRRIASSTGCHADQLRQLLEEAGRV